MRTVKLFTFVAEEHLGEALPQRLGHRPPLRQKQLVQLQHRRRRAATLRRHGRVRGRRQAAPRRRTTGCPPVVHDHAAYLSMVVGLVRRLSPASRERRQRPMRAWAELGANEYRTSTGVGN